MREFLINSKNVSDKCLLKVANVCEDPPKILNSKSTNLESVIRGCRMLLMTDNVKNKPRKIILDTKIETNRCTSPKNKETQRLSEIVFGNFCLSSKADGFKLHILRNPAEVIMSKLFNVPFNSVFYDTKVMCHKVSPDSGHNQSFSSNSSFNSIGSSNQSPGSSFFLQPVSVNSYESVASVQYLSKNASRNKMSYTGRQSSLNSLTKDETKGTQNGFFNENFEMCNCRNVVMMSVVFIFSLPDENKAEFEEFLFQYYVLLECVLNRIARLILNNCHSIYNGTVINCWKQSSRWLMSLLPKHSPLTLSSSTTNSTTTIPCHPLFDVSMLEEVVHYYSKDKRLNFLAQILSAVLISNPNASSKFLKGPLYRVDPVFPYSHILQSLGIDVGNHTYKRIIVKGGTEGGKTPPSSSWKSKVSSSFNYCKKIWKIQGDTSLSCSEVDLSIRKVSPETEFLTRTVSESVLVECREVQMITALVATLIRPQTKVMYHPHIVPSDLSTFIQYRPVRLSGAMPRSVALEVPLLDDGMVLGQEVLPDNKELFFPSIIADQVLGCPVPLQGFLTGDRSVALESTVMMESRNCEVIHDGKLYSPDFLVLDLDNSSVTVGGSQPLPPLSSWVQTLLSDFSVLIKVDGYDKTLGQLFLEAAFSNLSQKLCSISREEGCELSGDLLTLYGFTQSDVSLILPVNTL